MFKWIFGLLTGCCSIFLLPAVPPLVSLLSLIITAFLLLYVSNKSTNTNPILSAFSLFSSGILFGICWVSLHASWRIAQQIPLPENLAAHIIEGQVDSIPVIYPDYCQFQVKVTASKSLALMNKRLLLKDYQKGHTGSDINPCGYQLGQNWSLTVKLKPIHGPINQAGFDYEFYMFERGIDGKGYIKQGKRLTEAPAVSINGLRQYLYDELIAFDNAGIFQALVIGKKTTMTKESRDVLQSLGLSHLVAISGLHISIIAGVIFWITRKSLGWVVVLSKNRLINPFKAALIISCLAALIYSALADFSLPTVRALIMWCSVAGFMLLHRNTALWSGLIYALLLILTINPLSVLSAGFWMSFIAVAVISMVLFGRISIDQSWFGRLQKLIKLQVFITLVLALVSLLVFGKASLLGVIANIIVIPMFSLLILPLVLIGVLLLVITKQSWLLTIIDDGIGRFFQLAIEWRGVLESIQLDLFVSPWLLIAGFILSILLMMPLGKLKRPWILLLSILLFMAVGLESVLHQGAGKDSIEQGTKNGSKVIIFDVGHGLAVLLTDGKHHVLYDTGYASSGSSAFESYISPALKELRIKKLDALILSHKDNDHAGGAEHILNSMPVGELLMGKWGIGKSKIGKWRSRWSQEFNSMSDCRQGLFRRYGNFTLEAISPNHSESGDNDNSCVIKATFNNRHGDEDNYKFSGERRDEFSILLTGDIEKETEYRLAQNVSLRKQLKSDVLLVPHHGSNSSSTYPFIKMIDPNTVIYSTERYSRYNLPHSKVIKRYGNFDTKQLHTGCLGQITLAVSSGTYNVQRATRRIWRKPVCNVNEK